MREVQKRRGAAGGATEQRGAAGGVTGAARAAEAGTGPEWRGKR